MPTFHMDIEEARKVLNILAAAKGELEDRVRDIDVKVDNMVGSVWMGQSAIQFRDQFLVWRSQILQDIEYLELLSNSLRMEIEQWETSAASLDGDPTTDPNPPTPKKKK